MDRGTYAPFDAIPCDSVSNPPASDYTNADTLSIVFLLNQYDERVRIGSSIVTHPLNII